MWPRPICNNYYKKLGFRIMKTNEFHTSEPTCSAKKNHYDVLGLPKNATLSQIKGAFVKLAKQYHPDRDPGNKQLHSRFVEINEAYSVLSKEATRREYDRQLETGSSEYIRVHHQPPPPRPPPQPPQGYGFGWGYEWPSKDQQKQRIYNEDPFDTWYKYQNQKKQQQYYDFGPKPRPFRPPWMSTVEIFLLLFIFTFFGLIPFMHLRTQRSRMKERWELEQQRRRLEEETTRHWYNETNRQRNDPPDVIIRRPNPPANPPEQPPAQPPPPQN